MTGDRRLTYEEIGPIPRPQLERDLASGDPDTVCRAVVSAALFEEDWSWVEGWCMRLARDPRPQVRGCAATSLGHLARIHGVLHLEDVLPLLEELVADAAVGGRAEDALADIRRFVKPGTA